MLIVLGVLYLLANTRMSLQFIPEALAAAGEAGGEAGAAGGAEGAAGGAGGMADFNDMGVGKMAGSIGGKIVHTVMGAIGTPQGHTEQENIGPVGHA